MGVLRKNICDIDIAISIDLFLFFPKQEKKKSFDIPESVGRAKEALGTDIEVAKWPIVFEKRLDFFLFSSCAFARISKARAEIIIFSSFLCEIAISFYKALGKLRRKRENPTKTTYWNFSRKPTLKDKRNILTHSFKGGK